MAEKEPQEMSEQDQLFRILRSVVKQIEEDPSVRELEVRGAGFRIAAKKSSPATSGDIYLPEYIPRQEVTPATEQNPNIVGVKTPLTGIWYDSRSPSSPPFIRVGDIVEDNTIVGLVETMKVFNEVEAGATGVVEEVIAQRGDLVNANTDVARINQSVIPQTGPQY